MDADRKKLKNFQSRTLFTWNLCLDVDSHPADDIHGSGSARLSHLLLPDCLLRCALAVRCCASTLETIKLATRANSRSWL